MVAVPSTMKALGSVAPDFTLSDTINGDERISLSDASDKPVLLMFICNHCPFVIHIVEEMVGLGNWAQEQGCAVFAISANDVQAYPQDGPEPMAAFAKQYGMEFPYLYDETQEVAKAYGAACTPDFYLYDGNHRLQYRGQMDGARPNNTAPNDGADLRSAVEDVLSGKMPNESQIPSIGCSIKWRHGNEPDYF